MTVDELITGVNIALGAASLDGCPIFDDNSNGAVTVDELIAAVNNALEGCTDTTPLEEALQRFSEGNLQETRQSLSLALAEDPRDNKVALYLALTELALTVLDAPELRDLGVRAGLNVTGDGGEFCNMDVDVPDEVPIDAPRTGETIETLRTLLLPRLLSAIDAVSAVNSSTVIAVDLADLPECLRPNTDVETVEIDRGDLLVLSAALEAAAGTLEFAAGYDFDISLYQLLEVSHQAAVEGAPEFLTLTSPARLGSAKDLLGNALGRLSEAIDVVRSEQDAQDDDIFVIAAEDNEDANKIKLLLGRLRESLDREVSVPIDVTTGTVFLDANPPTEERLNLSRLFSGFFSSLRQFLPVFKPDGSFDPGLFPDPTFGGIAPTLTQDEIDSFFSGPAACSPCVDDADCKVFGIGELECLQCVQNCSGATARCADFYEGAFCEDGRFSGFAPPPTLTPTRNPTATPTRTPTATSTHTATVPASNLTLELDEPFLVNVGTAGHQTGPVIATGRGGTGEFVIVWSSRMSNSPGCGYLPGDPVSLVARRFGADGTPITGEFLIDGSSSRNGRASATLQPDGNLVVAWERESGEPRPQIVGRRFDRLGSPVGGEFGVSGSATQELGELDVDGDGNLVIIWERAGQVFGRRYDNTGTPLTPEVLLSTAAEQPRVATIPDGFVAFWNEDDGYFNGIFGRRYGVETNPVGEEFRVNHVVEGDQYASNVAADAKRFVVVWHNFTNEFDLFAQLFTTDGERIGSEFRVNGEKDGWQIEHSVAMDDASQFLATWEIGGFGDPFRVMARAFDRLGRPIGPDLAISELGDSADVGTVGIGRFVVAWQVDEGDSDGCEIFARHVTFRENGS